MCNRLFKDIQILRFVKIIETFLLKIVKNKATIYDIAKELNTTVSTVSRALADNPRISKATRQKVKDMAAKLKYTPNKLAASLKSGKSYTLGVIVPSMQNHFFASVIHSLESALQTEGYSVIVFQSNEKLINEKKGVAALMAAQVDGIVTSLSLETDTIRHFEEIVQSKKPVIVFDRTHIDLKVPTVTIDDIQAGYDATAHLITMGYKKIAMVSTSNQIKIFKDRYEGYKRALADNNIAVCPELEIFGNLSIPDGRSAAEKLLLLKPDAIIAGDDFTALGIIHKLKEGGITPPEIGVVGFANEVFSEFISPSLTSIDQMAENMGKECARIFLEMVKQVNPYRKVENVILKHSLVVRESSKKVNPLNTAIL